MKEISTEITKYNTRITLNCDSAIPLYMEHLRHADYNLPAQGLQGASNRAYVGLGGYLGACLVALFTLVPKFKG